ncbi:GNAT family N-acetyltransferase [Salinispora cortesiana]|uniref:GNAT family N-acetyltransferase n=1 Tax=Salinispora cortesiana TaxID=1305843 RepID=UPI000472268B|nr:GNAT family N-acetyltransferase [Salinispora cortesiana]
MNGSEPAGGAAIRPATAADAAAVAAVYVRSWRAAYAELLPQAVLASLDEVDWARRFCSRRDPARSTLLAFTPGRVVGVVMAGPDRQDPLLAEIYAIYVLPEIQGQGVGAALLDAAIAPLDAAAVRLWCAAANNNSRRFYERRGFVLDGATGSYEIGGHRLTTVRYTCSR